MMKNILLVVLLGCALLAGCASNSMYAYDSEYRSFRTLLGGHDMPGKSVPGYPAADANSAVVNFDWGAILVRNAPAELAGRYWFMNGERMAMREAKKCEVVKAAEPFTKERSVIDCDGSRYKVENWHYAVNGRRELVEALAWSAAMTIKEGEAVK